MEIRITQLTTRCARNVICFCNRKFSASSLPPKQSIPLRWVPLVVGGACVGSGVFEYIYPKSITRLFFDYKQDLVDFEASSSEEETDLSKESFEKSSDVPNEPEVEDACPFS